MILIRLRALVQRKQECRRVSTAAFRNEPNEKTQALPGIGETSAGIFTVPFSKSKGLGMQA